MSNKSKMARSPSALSPLPSAHRVLLNVDLLRLMLDYAGKPSSLSLLLANRQFFRAVVPHLWRRVPYDAIELQNRLWFERRFSASYHGAAADDDRRRHYLHAVLEVLVDVEGFFGLIPSLWTMSPEERALCSQAFKPTTLTSDWTALHHLCPNLRKISSRHLSRRTPLFTFTLLRRPDDVVMVERRWCVAVDEITDDWFLDRPLVRQAGFHGHDQYNLKTHNVAEEDWLACMRAVAKIIGQRGQLCGVQTCWEDLGDAAAILATYQASATVPLTDVSLEVSLCTLESFRRFTQSLGRQIQHLKLDISRDISEQNMSACDLPAIAKTIGEHCPNLETFDLAMYCSNHRRRLDADPVPPLPWSEVIVPPVGLKVFELELDDRDVMAYENIGSLAAIASSVACLTGPKCKFRVGLEDARLSFFDSRFKQSEDIEALVGIFQRMDPERIRKISAYHFPSLDISCPKDITALTFDELGEPIPLGTQRALNAIAEVEKSLARIERERVEILHRRQKADTDLRQRLARGMRRI